FAGVVGMFFKGPPSKPRADMTIVYEAASNQAPMIISGEQLNAIEPLVVKDITNLKERLGLKYRFLRLSTFNIYDRDALWIEGTVMKGNEKPKRDFTFICYRGNKLYVLMFTMPETEVQTMWPEIKAIIQSIGFS
ncbi:MAG TPA: hypothetical protein PLQ76_08490, partial [bacterium]|nr:hypothetical protein [bacterium]